MDAWLRVNYLDMYAGIVVRSFMGFCLLIVIDIAENYLCSWRQKDGKAKSHLAPL